MLVNRGASFAAAAVVLDDQTHLLPERRERDKFLNESCKRAEFPLIRVKTAQLYDVIKIRKTVQAHLPKGVAKFRPGDASGKDKKGKPCSWVWKRIR